jgi:hypothetical protein
MRFESLSSMPARRDSRRKSAEVYGKRRYICKQRRADRML